MIPKYSRVTEPAYNKTLRQSAHDIKQILEATSLMQIEEIREYLPHRYPFLLVDRVVDIELGKSITAIKNVSINEPYFNGHFPQLPILPGVLIIEAAMRSGSLITARFALEQNRDVFAVPGNINNPQIKGCHWLIKQGAKLVEELADIMEEVSFDSKNSLDLRLKQSRNKEKEKESKKSCDQDLFNDSLLASVGYEITPVDTVVSRSKLPTDVVLTRLTMLELRGLVSAVPGGYLKN